MKYDFDRIVPREKSNCVKYDTCEETFGRPDIIPMWIADMDFPVAPFVENAMRARMEHPVYGYAVRSESYYRSITGWVERRNNWKIKPHWIDFTPGVVSGFVFAIRALTAEGDGVVIQPPVYPPFAAMISANGRRIVNNPMKFTGGRFEIDFEELDRCLAGARALLFCNPHNPTGRVFSREELEKVGELCLKHNVVIISDEIHSDLIQKPYLHTHIASVSPRLAENTVTFIAPSKTFNLAGLSISHAITPGDSLRRRLRAELDKIHVDQGNVFGTAALEAAYTHGDEWVDQLNEYIGRNARYVAEFIDVHLPAVKTIPNEGTYLMWIDFRGLGMEHQELCRFLVAEARLGLNDGQQFGDQGRGFMRMNLATSFDTIKQAMVQLKNACDKIRCN